MDGIGRPRLYHADRPATTAERQQRFALRQREALRQLRAQITAKSTPRPRSQDWETPAEIFALYDAEFHFTLDVCAVPATAKCARFFSPEDNGLIQDWGSEICWMNPPYGRGVARWMEKAYRSARAGATVVAYVYAKTGTRWWHDWVKGKAEVREQLGRTTFVGAPFHARFDSAAVIYRPAP